MTADQPTDHRAEAEKWLHHAAQVEPGTAAIEFALIGIGHALLAGPPPPASRVIGSTT